MEAKKIEKELECWEEEEKEYAKMGKESLTYYKGLRDMDRERGRMYYSSVERYPMRDMPLYRRGREDEYRDIYRKEPGMGEYRDGEREAPIDFRDSREGRSPMSRRNYMESKELHQDKNKKMRELEKYLQELSQDILEMIDDASPEEKQMLEKKMTHLTSKIAQLNSSNA